MKFRTNNTYQASFSQYDLKESIMDSPITYWTMVTSAFFLCFLIAFSVVAETSEFDPVLEEITTSAMTDMDQNNYHSALEKLITVYGHAPMASIDHLLGVCYYNIKEYDLAEQHLSIAVEDMCDEGEEWNPFSGQAPRHASMYLGRVHMEQADFGNAVLYMSDFLVSLEMMDESEHWMIEWTAEAIAFCMAMDTPEFSSAE